MAHRANPGRGLRRITLPSGKTIEVVLLGNARPAAHPGGVAHTAPAEDGDGGPAAVTAPTAAAQSAASCDPLDSAQELHRCPACGSSLVYPLAWNPEGDRHWRIERRCPNC